VPKRDFVDPAVVRRPGTIEFEAIPVNMAGPSVETARESIGDDRLRGMLRDMVLIREFETMLDTIKRLGVYGGRTYQHRGPAHLGIGQEAAAVGQAAALQPTDFIFGNHRSHSEVLAKGLAAIERSDETWLARVMAEALDGSILRVVEALPAVDVRTRAVQFLTYGLLAEIFGRATGFNRGLGGSMHACFPPFGIYPNNAIVGGSAPVAAGAALFRHVNRQPGIVVANIGDGSAASGVVWESVNFASMHQYQRLWEEPRSTGLPILFFFVNNFYAMGGQTATETMGFDHVAQIGAAFGTRNLMAEVIDGNDPLAVMDCVQRKRAAIESVGGPALVDCQTYRQSGHSTSDAGSYRTALEIEAWKAADPIVEYGAQLQGAGVVSADWLSTVQDWATQRVTEAFKLATSETISPRLDPRLDPHAISQYMFSDAAAARERSGPGDLSVSRDDLPRMAQLAERDRRGVSEGGTRLPSTKVVTLRVALFEAIVDAVERDRHLIIYGEENRDWGGAFGVYQGLTELLPPRRLFNAPISEATIVGSAVGYAMAGGRALVELMYADFIGRAGDELFNQLAKWTAMSGGVLHIPVVVRISVGSKYGAQHSQDWTALVAHIPGLKVVYPATPYDAKGLLAAALAGDDPVVFFESQKLYDVGELFRTDGVPRETYEVPIGLPEVKRLGRDVSILAVGPALYPAFDASARLASEHGIEAELIDARSLVPLDLGPIIESVRKTSRLLLVSDSCVRGSFLNSIAAEIQLQAFDYLDGPVTVLGAPNWITPAAELEEAFFPTADTILGAIHEYLIPLPGLGQAAETRSGRLAAWQTGV
jgi:2-oxoisovalerate dehydrogenase E1 component